jgi:uncharacterized membrane protein
MNEEILICYITLFVFLIARLKYFGAIQFFQMLLTIFIIISLGTIIYLIYDPWLSEKLSTKQLENIVDYTYKDINNITTVVKDKNLPIPSFEKDEEDKKKNNRLIRDSLIIGIVNSIAFIVLLYYIDPKFYSNLKRNILSVIILYTVELYFSWSIITDFEGEGLEKVRHEIITQFLQN